MPSVDEPTRIAPKCLQSPLDTLQRAQVSLRLKNIYKSFTRAKLLLGR